MSEYRRNLAHLLVQSALDKSRAERMPRFIARADRSKFRQRYRKRLPNMPFIPKAIKSFEQRAIKRLVDSSLRRQAIARSRKIAKRDLYDNVINILHAREERRRYSLLPRSVKIERALEKQKFKKQVKKIRRQRQKAFRRLTRQELRRSGLTETEVQREITRRIRAGEPAVVPGEFRIFPGFAPPGFPGVGPPPPPPAIPPPPPGVIPGPPGGPFGGPPGPPRGRFFPGEEEGEVEGVIFRPPPLEEGLARPLIIEEEILQQEIEEGEEFQRRIEEVRERRREPERLLPRGQQELVRHLGIQLEMARGNPMLLARIRRQMEELLPGLDVREEIRRRELLEQGLEAEAEVLAERQRLRARAMQHAAEERRMLLELPRIVREERQLQELEGIEEEGELGEVAGVILTQRRRRLAREEREMEETRSRLAGESSQILRELGLDPAPEAVETSPEQSAEMIRQRVSEEEAEIERERVLRQLEQEQARAVQPVIPRPAVPIARELFQEPSAIRPPAIERALAPPMPGIEAEMRRQQEAQRIRRAIELPGETLEQELARIRSERLSAERLRRQIEAETAETEAQLERGRRQIEESRRLLESTSVERLEESERRLAEEVAELERLEKEEEGKKKRGKGLISGKYSKADREAFRKQHAIQVDLFRMERERRARIHERPFESIAAEALERSGRKPNKYIKFIKKVKKAYPHISDKEALKGGHKGERESFGEGKKVKGAASRKAALKNPWILHLKKVLKGYKKKYPKKSHKEIMKMVKASYKPKKKGGEILPGTIVLGLGGKKKKKSAKYMKHLKKIQKKYPHLSAEVCEMMAEKTYKNPEAMKKIKKMMKGGEFYGIK